MDKEKLVLSIVKEYLYKGLTEEELEQAGFDGLRIAEEKYDERADFSFESYALWWIRRSILQAITEKSTQ